jgi:hypothetical protein
MCVRVCARACVHNQEGEGLVSPTAGGATVRVQGQNFGPGMGGVQEVSYADVTPGGLPVRFTAANCTMAVPHRALQCRTGPGAGTGLVWRVVVASQVRGCAPTHPPPPPRRSAPPASPPVECPRAPLLPRTLAPCPSWLLPG